MISIIEKQGFGWDNINNKTFFKRSEGCQHEDAVMFTSKQYEECFIIFSTMKYIKMTIKNKDKRDETKFERVFEIKCVMNNYKVSNNSIRRRHSDMFKNDDFFFCPTNDLVKSMPFDFVNNLNGKLTKLDKKWLQGIEKTLKQAVSNSIKDVTFVRTIMNDNMSGKETELFTRDDCHIYQVTMDNDAKTRFYVN